jgi:hypothetical protein
MKRSLVFSHALLALVITIHVAARATADESAPAPLSLVRPNSLTGWRHGDAPPTGWTADGQRLRGCEQGSPLVSAWTFGDFVLDVVWSPVESGTIEVLLPSSPEGNLLTIALGNDRSGRIIDGDQELAGGQKIAPQNDPYRARIERTGETLRVSIDGEKVSEATIASDRRLGLSLHVPRGVVTIDQLAIAEPRGAPLFNGQDLTGWNTFRKAEVWSVENGELVTTKNGGEYLRSDKEFGDFTLSFDYLTEIGGNSGLGIRTPLEKWPSGEGMELQIYDRPGKEAGSMMSIYKYVPPLERPDRSGEWNSVVVKCEGPIITAWVNGQIAQHANLDDHPQLAKKPRRGWLGFQHHGSATRLKNIYLLEQPAETAAPVTEDGAAVP